MSNAPACEQRLTWELGHPIIDTNVFSLYLEKQLSDTVLSTAQVPINYGDSYIGIHMRPLDTRQSIVATMTTGLAEAAEGLHQYLQTWDRETGEPPRQIVGVTYMGLARLGRYAGFSCVELPKNIFNKKENDFRWGWYAAELGTLFESETERGRQGKPLRVSAIYQPVDRFINTWRHSQNDRSDVITVS